MDEQSKPQKVAIVHDWLVGGGAEKVVQALHEMFPEAPIYTSYSTDEWRKKLDNKVVTGALQHWPFGTLRKFIPPLRIWWFRSLDLDGYDLIISSSGNGEAKHIRKPKGAKHINYCHTPPHFLWRHYDQYMKTPGFGLFNSLARLGLKLLVGPLRKADYAAAQKVDQFIANSTHIQSDIKKYYGRDSVVIHPPVDVERFRKYARPQTERHGFVTVGRLVPYKRVDIIVDACTQLGLDLKVIGKGPELANLQKRAGPTIQFITDASDEVVATEMGQAEAFIFAAFEDFGITPVEAMAVGTPVIAYKAGGALDYVIEGKTGLFFSSQSSQALMALLSHINLHDLNIFPAENFPKSRFVNCFNLLIPSL
jgi:glycosyltransferase involved in cell wall biosynthesis